MGLFGDLFGGIEDTLKQFVSSPRAFLFGTRVDSLLRARKLSQAKNPIEVAGLQDKSFSAADYGVPLTIGYGKFKTNGKVMWGLDEFRDYSRSYEDNGQTIVERAYETDIAWKICKGPVVGVSRIWLDDVLILDTRSETTGAVGKDLYSYSVKPSGRIEFIRRVAGDINLETFNIYLGTDDQGPDELMELRLGTGNVSAHRGWCYITAKNLYLNTHGRRVPNLTAEVVVSGSTSDAANGTITATLPAPPAFPSYGVDARCLMYDPQADLFIAVMNQNSASPNGSSALTGFRPLTHEIIFSVDHTLGGTGTWEKYSRLDDAAPYIWASDQLNVVAFSTYTGQKVINLSRSGVGSTHFQRCIVEAFNSRDELWYNANNGNFVFRKSAILAGASLALAYLRTETQFNTPPSADWLFAVPHRSMMLAQLGLALQWGFYDSNSVKSGPFVATGYDFGSEPIIDAYNDCIWVSARTAPFTTYDLLKFDLTNNTFNTITTNISVTTAIFLDSNRNAIVVYRGSVDKFEWYDGSGAKIKELSVTETGGTPFFGAFSAAHNEFIFNRNSSPYNTIYSYLLDRSSSSAVALSSVITSLATEAGIPSGDLNVSVLASTAISGIAIEERAQAKAALDLLQRASFFDLVQENGKVTAKKRGGASVMTIDYTELALDDGDEQRRPYKFFRADEIDNAARYEVLYSDIDLEYEDNVQASTRHVVRSREVERSTIPVLMTASQAKQVSEVELYSRWSQRVGIRLNGTRKHWKLRAGDVFTFTDELGVSRTLLCTKIEFTSMTSCIIEARMEDASVYTSTATGAGVNWTPPTISASTGKRFELLDISILDDADDYQGFYVTANPGAPTAYLWGSTDGGVTYTNLGQLSETPIGYASTTLANFTGGNVWDTVSTVTVVIYSGTLSSATDAQLLAGVNMFLCGNEIIQAGTVTPSGTNTYILSRLLRGRKGTEWAINLHSAGERFVGLASLKRVASSLRGTLAYYKAVPSGTDVASVTATAFTNTQAGMKPYSPVYISGSRDGGLNLTISWTRRSRIGTAWGSALTIPLGESTEQYQVDIMSGSIVKRTITVDGATTTTYSAADQATDFGATQSSVLVNIYQMSTVVGRGTVGVATV